MKFQKNDITVIFDEIKCGLEDLEIYFLLWNMNAFQHSNNFKSFRGGKNAISAMIARKKVFGKHMAQ